jgi:hypothetical protein
MRAVDGHDVIPITMVMTPREGLSTEARTMASGRNGITRNQSVRRIRTLSDTPPRYPATIPMRDPIVIEIAVASSPTVSETREPQIVRVRTERPKLSVPSGYFSDGGEKGIPLQGQVAFRPSLLASSGAKIATRTNRISTARPIMPSVFFRYVFQILPAETRRLVQAI